MAKALVDYFAQQQIAIHYGYARAIINACPHSIRRRYVRAGDAWTWWVLHPEFKPFAASGCRHNDATNEADLPIAPETAQAELLGDKTAGRASAARSVNPPRPAAPPRDALNARKARGRHGPVH
jgi:hypothetical protein